MTIKNDGHTIWSKLRTVRGDLRKNILTPAGMKRPGAGWTYLIRLTRNPLDTPPFGSGQTPEVGVKLNGGQR